MTIRVFEINDVIREENLGTMDIENITKIFNKIFEPKNADHLKIGCFANHNSIIKRYNNEPLTFDLKKFADELASAEKKQDGTRNKQITEGYLFIKQEKSQISLLKLENIEVIDKEKNYEIKKSFSTESNYYKGCIFNVGNNKNITIIDKNKSIAKYWREDFLNLSLIREEFKNSLDLITLLKNDSLFSEKIKNQDNFEAVKSFTEDFIFENNFFDKINLGNKLRAEKFISHTDLNDIYSEKSKLLDTEFNISKKALKQEYKKTIQISKETKIYTDNYSKLFKRDGIKFENGNIILSVNNDFIQQLPEDLRNGH